MDFTTVCLNRLTICLHAKGGNIQLSTVVYLIQLIYFSWEIEQYGICCFYRIWVTNYRKIGQDRLIICLLAMGIHMKLLRRISRFKTTD